MAEANVIFDNYIYNNANSYNKEEWVNKMKELRSELHDMSKSKLNVISRDMNALANYLRIQSKFNLYSVNNCLLIMAQMPNATYFKDKKSWEKDGYIVKRQDKGFHIFESEPYVTEDGSSGVYYNPKKVYDITYTNAPLGKFDRLNLSEKEVLSSLVSSCPMKLVPVDKIEGTQKSALYNKDQNCIYVAKGREVKEIIQDLVLEESKMYMIANGYEENSVDFNALCISYMFCRKNGVDFPKEEFTKVENQFSKMEIDEIKLELNTIRDTFENINSRMVNYIQQEKKSKEQVR